MGIKNRAPSLLRISVYMGDHPVSILTGSSGVTAACLLTSGGSLWVFPLYKASVADPDRFGPDPDPTSENRLDLGLDSDPVKTGSGFI